MPLIEESGSDKSFVMTKQLRSLVPKIMSWRAFLSLSAQTANGAIRHQVVKVSAVHKCCA